MQFKDENLLRKFNVIACSGKGWLPDDYGTREYNNCSEQDKAVVDSFEGLKSYNKNFSDKAFFATNTSLLQIAA